MHIVESANTQPGCCVLSGSSEGPFVVLERPLGPEAYAGGTPYISVRVAEAIARSIGFEPAGDIGDAQAKVAAADARAQAAEERYDHLQAAVGTTLQHGAVVRSGVVSLRQPLARRKRSG